jgi:hypothetical protein
MQFVATFNVDVKFNDPAKFAAFAVAFQKLYGDFFSGDAPLRQTQAATTLPVAPQPVPPAPHSRAEAAAERKAQFDALPQEIETAPNPQVAIDTAPDAVGAPVAAVATDSEATEPAKPKRHRRTKAEIAADKAREEAARAQPTPDLPKAHGGSNTGTTAQSVQTQLPDIPMLPEPGERIDVPEGEISGELLQKAWASVLMMPHTEAEALALLSTVGITRCKEAQPQHYRPLVEGLVRILRANGK